MKGGIKVKTEIEVWIVEEWLIYFRLILSDMLEKQEKRDISLVDVATECREQAQKLALQQRLLPPVLSPERMSISKRTDSGISSTAKVNSEEKQVS